MPKGTLYDVLHKSPTLLDWSKRINIALGVAHALAHLHRACTSKILHMDLKSSNVFLDDDLNPLVADYGLIALVSKTVVETPGYTPPEFTSVSYSVRRYTEKVDVYSFGILLLELLTGKTPVSHEEDNSRRTSHDEEDKSSIANNEEKEKSPIANNEEKEKSPIANNEEKDPISPMRKGALLHTQRRRIVSHLRRKRALFQTKRKSLR
ncbi:hypothetical protein GOP47_0030527 [Adiantum capillus-veneris]|nr:hypothetical protein GOP47_0030527 [Adiantum capillus-veneris]